MKIVPSLKFSQDFKKLIKNDSKYFQRTTKCLQLLSENLNHPSLRLHKLAGVEIFSVSVDMKIRILIQIDGNDIHLLRIGNHTEMYGK